MSLQDLKSLIVSHHPLIVMDASDPNHTHELLEAAADALQLPLHRWSLKEASNPATLGETLGIAEQMEMESIFLFEGLDEYLEDPNLIDVFERVCAKFRFSRSCLALAGDDLKLPAELDADAALYQVCLPDAAELRQLLDELLEEHSGVDLEEKERDAVVGALQGMSRNQARQSLMRAIFEQRGVAAEDVGNREKQKTASVRAGGLVEFYPVDFHAVQLPGFENLCNWIEQPVDAAKARSVMIAGLEPSGQQVAVRVVAHRKALPLLKFDARRLSGMSQEDAEAQFDAVIEIAESAAPCVFCIDGLDDAVKASANPNMCAKILAWLEGRNERPEILLAATATDLDQLPNDFAQAAAFDEVFFVDLPTAAERVTIWNMQLQQRGLQPRFFDIGFFVDATDGFTSSEIEQTIVAAMYRAADLGKELDQQLLTSEVYATVPSSISQASEFSRLRRAAADRAELATEPERESMTLAA